MKHIKLFEEFNQDLFEGAIPVYPAGNPWKSQGSIQWTGIADHINTKWPKQYPGITNYTFVADFDFDKYIADDKYRSVPLGTWKDKTLPSFMEANPKYDATEFDFVEIVPNQEKPNEPWLKIADKNDVQFMVPPFKILDIQMGSSVRDGITSGEKFLIDDMRAGISDYRDKTVYVKLQDGTKREYSLEDWKSKNYTALDEKASNEEIE